MSDFEVGWDKFAIIGRRIQVRTEKGWLTGTVRETPFENDRAIVVVTDQPYSENKRFYNCKGATVMVMHNTRRGIWSNLRDVKLLPSPQTK